MDSEEILTAREAADFLKVNYYVLLQLAHVCQLRRMRGAGMALRAP